MGALVGYLLGRKLSENIRKEQEAIASHDAIVKELTARASNENFAPEVRMKYLEKLGDVVTSPRTKFNPKSVDLNAPILEYAQNQMKMVPSAAPPSPPVSMVPKAPPQLGPQSPDFQQFMGGSQEQEPPKPLAVPTSYRNAANPVIPEIPQPPVLENAGYVNPQATLAPVPKPLSMELNAFDPRRKMLTQAEEAKMIGLNDPNEIANFINRQWVGEKGNRADEIPWVGFDVAGQPVAINKKSGEFRVGPNIPRMPSATANRPTEVNPGNTLVAFNPETQKYEAVFTAPPTSETEKVPPGGVGQWIQIKRIKATKPKDSPEYQAAVEAENEIRRKAMASNEGLDIRRDNQAKSVYDASNRTLENLYKPITDTLTRVSRLEESLNQNNPVADALVAPELLIVMAGGQGSGLRMAEAEIARIVGGRSAWETLKADINKWQLDPKAAVSIQPAERKMIRDLTAAVRAKLERKRVVMDNAFEGLLTNINDPEGLRKVPIEARKAITEIDTGAPGVTPPPAKGKIRVRRKSDGQIGEISPQYFDPNKYDKQ